MVSEYRLYLHLFSKENIWSNPQQFPAYNPVIQTRTIILWTELFPKKRREKIQGEILQSIFEYSGVSTFLQELQYSTCNPAGFQSSRAILHTELILLQEFSKKYYNYKAHPVSSRADHYKASSSNCSPCIQAFYTAESSHKAPYSIPGPYSTSRLPVILPGRNSILSGSQHPRTPYSSSQASSTLQNSTRRNRILSKRVKYCISNTILRSVCSNLFILVPRINLQEI